MGFQQGQGKGVFVRKLVDYHGYKVVPATKIVNQVIDIIVKAIKEGKAVEIPGLGVIETRDMTASRKRQIITLMKGKGRSVMTLYKKTKLIRLVPDPPYMKED